MFWGASCRIFSQNFSASSYWNWQTSSSPFLSRRAMSVSGRGQSSMGVGTVIGSTPAGPSGMSPQRLPPSCFAGSGPKVELNVSSFYNRCHP